MVKVSLDEITDPRTNSSDGMRLSSMSNDTTSVLSYVVLLMIAWTSISLSGLARKKGSSFTTSSTLAFTVGPTRGYTFNSTGATIAGLICSLTLEVRTVTWAADCSYVVNT